MPAADKTRLAPDAHDCCFEPASECVPTSRTTAAAPSTASASGATAWTTASTLEILRLIAGGRSNAEIAVDLFMSEATVKTQVTHILSKLRLRDRVQAVALASRTGLIDSDPWRFARCE